MWLTKKINSLFGKIVKSENDIVNLSINKKDMQQKSDINEHKSNIGEKVKVNWLKELDIPYERSIMLNEQIRQETLKMYSKLCNFVDKILHELNTCSLLENVEIIANSGKRYNNILYTFYSIAEGHVTKGYSGKTSYYDYTFSYQILEDHLGAHIKQKTFEYAEELEKKLSSPTQETIEYFNLTPSKYPEL